MSNFVDVPMSAEKTFRFQPVFVSTPTPSLVLLSFSFLIASEISSWVFCSCSAFWIVSMLCSMVRSMSVRRVDTSTNSTLPPSESQRCWTRSRGTCRIRRTTGDRDGQILSATRGTRWEVGRRIERLQGVELPGERVGSFRVVVGWFVKNRSRSDWRSLLSWSFTDAPATTDSWASSVVRNEASAATPPRSCPAGESRTDRTRVRWRSSISCWGIQAGRLDGISTEDVHPPGIARIGSVKAISEPGGDDAIEGRRPPKPGERPICTAKSVDAPLEWVVRQRYVGYGTNPRRDLSQERVSEVRPHPPEPAGLTL